MIPARDKPPGNLNHLNELLTQLAAGLEELPLRLRTTIANTVVAQLLPDGVVKGGSAMKLRLGASATRFTPDLDFARSNTVTRFDEEFSSMLAAGWGGFTGRLVPQTPPRPRGVPAAYIMKPYEVRLAYRHKSWCTVVVEVGHDEIGDTDNPTWVVAEQIVEIFLGLGLQRPQAVPVLAAEHQIAQKLHALSAPSSQRAHDLVDLQLLISSESPDLPGTRAACERLFTSRRAHHWPPSITVGNDWDTLYAAAAEGIGSLALSAAEAVAWVNALVGRIAEAE